mmetsp:Transcript_55307/g.145890  ORF Transcript_55307/g.145890 Transcript_55307/m.145890 type:complete len:116 (+) Transcript_55307:347-694(+)
MILIIVSLVSWVFAPTNQNNQGASISSEVISAPRSSRFNLHHCGIAVALPCISVHEFTPCLSKSCLVSCRDISPPEVNLKYFVGASTPELLAQRSCSIVSVLLRRTKDYDFSNTW